MPQLTRRRNNDPHREGWTVSFGDVEVGYIGRRAGVPPDAYQWGWSCGFYPGCGPGEHRTGSAPDFLSARRDFEAAWQKYLPTCTDADFTEHRRERAWTRWKYEMQEAGCKMPTQVPELRSRCYCGAEIGVACEEHVYAQHMDEVA